MSFLEANLSTRENYFSVIYQNNKIKCLLHFHSCFTFEFSLLAVMISYQKSSSQCMNFRRRGLVWNQSPSCFHFNEKLILCLKYRNNNATKVELDYQENHTLYLRCCRSFLKNASWTWKVQSDFHDFIKISAKRHLLLLLLPMSSTLPSNYNVKTFEMK